MSSFSYVRFFLDNLTHLLRVKNAYSLPIGCDFDPFKCKNLILYEFYYGFNVAMASTIEMYYETRFAEIKFILLVVSNVLYNQKGLKNDFILEDMQLISFTVILKYT